MSDPDRLAARTDRVAVRLARADDLETWCCLRHALWQNADRAELVEEGEDFFARRGNLQAVFLVEASSGAVLGMLELSLRSYAEGCQSPPVPYVEGWYVVPEARRRGIGRALMTAAEAWARARDYPALASDALIDNLVSERAHLAAGFEEVVRIVHFRKDL